MAEQGLDAKLQEIDDSLRSKYLKEILSLSKEDLSKVKINKGKYKAMVKAEILSLRPEAGDKKAYDTA